jgi:HK97 family phage major capsid protein
MDLKELHEDIKSTFASFKAANDALSAESKKNGEASAAAKEKVDKVEASLQKLVDTQAAEIKAQKERIDQLETWKNRGHFSDAADQPSDEEKRIRNAYFKYLRKGRLSADEEKILVERKDFATDSGVDGGYLVPHVLSSTVLRKLIETSPIRQYASLQTLSVGNVFELPVENTNFSSGRVSERATRSTTTSGQFKLEKIPVHGYYAMPAATQWMLDDPAFNLESYITEKIVERLSVDTNTDFITGTGLNMPEGIATNASVSTTNLTTSSAIDPDKIMDLFYSVPAPYAANATWLWLRTTTGKIRKVKGTTSGDYLWQPGLTVSSPPSFMGRPYIEMVDMPAYTAGSSNKCIVVGDLARAYLIVDKPQIVVVRDNITSKGFILFYHEMRTGGQVVLPEAIKYGIAN